MSKLTQQKVHHDGGAEVVNFYRLLNITPDASRMEVRDAYLRAKSAFSADSQALYSLMSEEESRAHLAMIDQAYLTLEDEESRERYDRRLKSQTSPAGGVRRRVVGDGGGLTHQQAEAGGNMDLIAATMGETEILVHPTPVRPVPVIRTTAQLASSPEIQQEIAKLLADADKGDGDLLRRIREACGVTVDEMQERTKILADYIRGIEENRFDRLPPAVYVKGFIRSYLKYLAIPEPDRFATAYGTRMEEWRTSARN